MNERQDTIPLMTLPMVTPKVGHNVPGLTTNCAIIGGKYLECDGKWHQLNITLVRSRFYLSEDEFLYVSLIDPFLCYIVVSRTIEDNLRNCRIFEFKYYYYCYRSSRF